MKTVLDVIPDLMVKPEDEAQVLIISRVGEAYKAVFTGNAMQDDLDLVLVDLAQFSRYYDTAEIGAEPQALAAVAHRKAVLDHIMDAIEQRGGKIEGLRVATLRAPFIYEE